MDREKLESILDLHRKWLYNEEGGERADLYGADLYGANLRGADLYGADLRGAKNAAVAQAMTEIVPREGSFVGWKQCRCGLIVKLRIPEDAKRSNATGRKCRASKVEVLAIESVDGKEQFDTALSLWDESFSYNVGETIEVADFDEDRFHKCAAGIHFFITREEAVDFDF